MQYSDHTLRNTQITTIRCRVQHSTSTISQPLKEVLKSSRNDSKLTVFSIVLKSKERGTEGVQDLQRNNYFLMFAVKGHSFY